MALLTTRVVLRDWAFSPGPEQMDEPNDSQFVDEISQLSAKSIAATLLAFPRVEVVHPADPSWFEWRAGWSNYDRFINLTMTLFDDLEENWGGSEIEVNCLAGDIMDLWSFIRRNIKVFGSMPQIARCTRRVRFWMAS